MILADRIATEQVETQKAQLDRTAPLSKQLTCDFDGDVGAMLPALASAGS